MDAPDAPAARTAPDAPDAPKARGASPARARRRAVLLGAAAFVALTLVLVRERAGETGLWDWDTYGRLTFIHDYHPEIWLDGHVLYHGVLRALMRLGLRPVTAIAFETAMGAAAFLLLLRWLCRRHGLDRRDTWLVLAAATVGSPALVALYLMNEDNVLYLPLVLGAFHALYASPDDRRGNVRRGVVAGALIAGAMLTNVSLLVMLFPLPVALVVWLVRRDRHRALGVVVTLASALACYYAAHVFPFGGAKIALHEFLPQALRLQDFDQSTTPLASLDRFGEYRSGLRAMALTPSVHLMDLPATLRAALLGPLAKLMFVLAACLLGWVVRFRADALRAALRTRLDVLGLVGVAVVFPYFYEPALIERWDLAWVGLLFALIPFFRLRPSRVAIGLFAGLLALGGLGTGVTVAHHYGAAWQRPVVGQLRDIAHDVVAQNLNPVVMPYDLDRLAFADFAYRIGDRVVYLARDDGGQATVVRVVSLGEHPVPLGEVRDALRGKHAYVSPWLPPAARAALDAAP